MPKSPLPLLPSRISGTWILVDATQACPCTCCEVQRLCILCNDATAAQTGAQATHAETSPFTTKLHIEICHGIHEEQGATWEECHQATTWPIVQHSNRVKGVCRARTGAAPPC